MVDGARNAADGETLHWRWALPAGRRARPAPALSHHSALTVSQKGSGQPLLSIAASRGSALRFGVARPAAVAVAAGCFGRLHAAFTSLALAVVLITWRIHHKTAMRRCSHAQQAWMSLCSAPMGSGEAATATRISVIERRVALAATVTVTRPRMLERCELRGCRLRQLHGGQAPAVSGSGLASGPSTPGVAADQ